MLKETFVESIVDTLAKEIVAASKIGYEKYAFYICVHDEPTYTLLLSFEHGGDIPIGMVKVSAGPGFVADNCRSCEIYVPESLFYQTHMDIDQVKQLVHSLCSTEYIRRVHSVNVVKVDPASFDPPADLRSLANIKALRTPKFFRAWVAEWDSDITNEYIMDFGGEDPDLLYLEDWIGHETSDDSIRIAFSNYVEYCCWSIVFARA